MSIRCHEDSIVRAVQTENTADALIDSWGRAAAAASRVDASLYTNYDVKRGLRDISGKGVLAGLTKIGDVIASDVDAEEFVAASGQLIYRGIDIAHLVEGFTAERRLGFEETCYLLLFGTLPDKDELCRFEERLGAYRVLPKGFVHDAILEMPSNDIMNALARSVLALYAIDSRPDDISISNVLRQSLQLIAAFPALTVYSYQAYLHHFKNKSLVIHSPVLELSTAENILHMLRSDSRYSQLEASVLDLALILHAEHGGGNNSSFTMHVVSSSGTDTYSAVAAALGSLKGPRHGGANIKTVQMLEELKQQVYDWEDDCEIEQYLLRLLNKDAFDRSGLIYGVGHAVYSASDPRALILKKYAETLAKEKGLEDEFRLYAKVEEMAPEIINRKRKMYKGVCANVDFYSGFVYRMLDIPKELFTPLFAISRIVGWCAHRIEELTSGGKIIRPAYKGITPRRKYIALDKR
ncbi:MAG: citrate/2-methylcitrate synthase [bacterium]|jgi:citrate synthase|nr:citrate/2-methylcitrate synthase [bacterium]MDD3805930.1 citrate/2-methylcitrate synthase [bacterium]MDD4152610.1 citrate/2-methylcitrate synthase [bacterium]